MKDPSFLKTMVQKVGARRVLEIGTSDGSSALAMAEMLPEDGTLLTCEINAGLATLARKRLGRSPHGRKVEVLVGPARESLGTLAGPFDLIFVDADTRNYVHYYHCALELLAPTGALLMDNTRGMALGAVDPSLDPAIAAIQELAQLIRSDNRINSQLMAVRDGVLVVTWVGQTSGSN
ncbi:MAG TPA: class I SAM-dependent methyltransferase [Chthoniobacterales bacterium]|jgi:caffeoyl-CoA O-methyltransferase|nr:class I SAM-dependent methyltransferase [Nitrospira sp.]HVE15647.1 class I SAM-dependent methyltransferase [Chthoniobacterales bacterium]